jgi:serine palmitoyltransferase
VARKVELVHEWTPKLLGAPAFTPDEQIDLALVPVVSGPNGPRPKIVNTGKQALNLSSYNFTGLTGDETIKMRTIETLRKYGIVAVDLLDFMVLLVRQVALNSRRHELFCFADVHMDLERDIADFLGTESSILYSQGLSTVPCVIPSFAKRGDIIVAERGINFAIQKSLQISRCTVRWLDHNDLKSLEEVLLVSVEKERRKYQGPPTRRFIVTEGIFEKDGTMIDLPKIVSYALSKTVRLRSDPSLSQIDRAEAQVQGSPHP